MDRLSGAFPPARMQTAWQHYHPSPHGDTSLVARRGLPDTHASDIADSLTAIGL